LSVGVPSFEATGRASDNESASVWAKNCIGVGIGGGQAAIDTLPYSDCLSNSPLIEALRFNAGWGNVKPDTGVGQENSGCGGDLMPGAAPIPSRRRGRKPKVTDDMLKDWSVRYENGIDESEGLRGVAMKYKVKYSNVTRYLKANGELTQHAYDRLNPDEFRPVTDSMLKEWHDLGKDAITKEGGRLKIAQVYKVRLDNVITYLTWEGELREPVMNRLGLTKKATSPQTPDNSFWRPWSS
jgi:hypothetical protein